MDSGGNLSYYFQSNISLEFHPNLTFDELIFDNSTVRFGLYVIYTLVFGLCFFGNLAVVLTVTFHWRMRNATKFCMGNLAVANLCVAVFCIYQNLYTFLRESWIFGRLLCKMYHFTNILSYSASILILVVICGERYLSIVHPLRCRGMITIHRLRVTIVGVWVLSGLISSPRLFYITTFEVPIPIGPDGHYDIICAPQQTLYDFRAADTIYFFVLFLLPLLLMSVLYTKIARVLWRSSTVPPTPHGSTLASSTRSRKPSQTECSNPANLQLTPLAPQTSPVNQETSGSALRAGSSTITIVRGRTRANMGIDREDYNTAAGFEISGDGSSRRKWRILPSKRQGPGPGESIDNGEAELSPETMCRSNSAKVPQSRRAAIRMLVVIVISFVVCNFPYHIRKICQYYMGNVLSGSTYSQLLTPITFLLMYTNCAINPIIYFFMSKEFRSSLRELLQLRLARPHPQGSRRSGCEHLGS